MSTMIRIRMALIGLCALLCSFIPQLTQPQAAQARALATTSDQATSFYNPIVPDLADPSVLFYNGYYYSPFSDLSNNISLYKARNLSKLGEGSVSVLWQHPGNGSDCCDVWAPELKLINGTFYIYFAADDGNNDNHRMFALQADTGDPGGSYSFKGELAAITDRWAIDGNVIQQGSALFFVWSGWEGTTNGQQNLYIAPMRDPLTIAGDRVQISAPDQSWENVGGGLHINEAPAVLARNGKIFITYSANGSTTDNYCLGMLTASDSANLLDPNAWVKSNGPVFSQAPTAYGPGSNTFTTSPDGSEDWIVYNATVAPGNGSTDNWKNRSIRAQKFSWDGNGNPVFGSPAAITTRLALPAGEHYSNVRYEAELATINDANVIVRTGEHTTHTAASHDEDVGQLDNSDSYVDFTVTAPQTGTYALTEGYSNGFAVTASHHVFVNGQDVGYTNLPGTGAWNQFSAAGIHVNLSAGTNTIRLARGSNWAEIDYIELPIYEAEDGQVTAANINGSNNASNGAKVGQIDQSDSAVLFDVYAPTSGNYTLQVGYSDGFSINASHTITIDGSATTSVGYSPTGGWDSYSTAAITLSLGAGGHTLRFSRDTNWAELDYIELSPA